MSMYEFSKRVRIPSSTLHSYAHANASQRQRLGSSAGKPAIVNDETAQFAVDVLRRRDRGNDGMNHREAIDMVHDLMPMLSRKQVSQTFLRTIRPGHSSELSNIVKAQASTTKRSSITIPQQYRWHTVCTTHSSLLIPHPSLLSPHLSLLTPHSSLSYTHCHACMCTDRGQGLQHVEGTEFGNDPRREIFW